MTEVSPAQWDDVTDWLVPSDVHVEGGFVYWTEIQGDVGGDISRSKYGKRLLDGGGFTLEAAPTIEGAETLLRAFMALRDEPDDEIEKFARKWGPLRLCEHGWPTTLRPDAHSGFPQRFDDRSVGRAHEPASDAPCLPLHGRPGSMRRGSLHSLPFRESIGDWRRWASMAYRLVCIADALRTPGESTYYDLHFEEVLPLLPRFQVTNRMHHYLADPRNELGHVDDSKEDDERSYEEAYRELAGMALDRWAELGEARLHVGWYSPGSPAVTTGMPTLFSGLTLALLLNVGRISPDRPCVWCGKKIESARRGQRLCGSQGCKRMDARERKRLERSRAAGGESMPERTCLICTASFIPRRRDQWLCGSPECKRRAAAERQQQRRVRGRSGIT